MVRWTVALALGSTSQNSPNQRPVSNDTSNWCVGFCYASPVIRSPRIQYFIHKYFGIVYGEMDRRVGLGQYQLEQSKSTACLLSYVQLVCSILLRLSRNTLT